MEAKDSSLKHSQYLVRNKHGEDEVIDISSHNMELGNLPDKGAIDEAFRGLRAEIAAMNFCGVKARKEMLASLDTTREKAYQEWNKVAMTTQLHVPVAELRAAAENAIRNNDGGEPLHGTS
jgi:hypothetical protein